MKKLWLLAPACVLLFSLQVLAAPKRVDSRIAKTKDSDATVELFDAIKSGDIEVRVIAKDAAAGNVLIKNTTGKRLSIKLPEVFAAVPVAAQFGGGGMFAGPFGGGGNPFGGGMMNGGGMMGAGMNGMMGGQNQALGGSFPGMNGGGNGMGPGLGIGNGRNGGGLNGAGFNGGIFKIEPEKVGKIKMASVCLEHGKPDPTAKIEYELRPIESVTSNPQIVETVRMLARTEIDQRSAQAAAWHLANGLTWEQLANKIGVKHIDGRVDPYFTAEHVQRGQEIVAEAQKRSAAQPTKLDDGSDSLAAQR
jgi:hypothetical protein